MSETRGSGENGPEPLHPQHVVGWMAMHNVSLSTMETRIIAILDRVFRNAVERELDRNGSRKPEDPASRVYQHG